MTPVPMLLDSLENEVAYLLDSKAAFFPPSRRSSAALSVLETLYEELESAWQELSMASEQQLFEAELQNFELRKQNLQQRKAERPANLQRSWQSRRQEYVRNLQERKTSFAEKQQHWERTKQTWRDSLKASKRALKAKATPLTWPLEQLANWLLHSYQPEWQRAEQRIATQNTLLQQAENGYAASLQEKKRTLTAAFNAAKQSLSELQHQNGQRKNALPALVATWKADAAAREMRCNARLTELKQTSWNSSTSKLSPDTLTSRQQHLTERRESLQQRQKESAAKKHFWPPSPSTKPLSNPGAMPYAQLINELPRLLKQNAAPLRLLLHELVACAASSSELKMQLLTAGLLDQSQFPELDTKWRNLNP